MWKSEKFARFDTTGAQNSYTLLINIIPAHFSYMSAPSRTFDGIWLFLHEVSWCQNCFVCAFLCHFSKFFIMFSLHARHAGLPTMPICSHTEEEEKRMTSWLFPYWQLDVSVWMGERIFAVHALFIRNWPTVLRHRAMVSTCRIHGPIFGHWHSIHWTYVYFRNGSHASHTQKLTRFHSRLQSFATPPPRIAAGDEKVSSPHGDSRWGRGKWLEATVPGFK